MKIARSCCDELLTTGGAMKEQLRALVSFVQIVTLRGVVCRSGLERVFLYGIKQGSFHENSRFLLYSRKAVSARLRIGQNDIPESDGNILKTSGAIFESVK